jgi:hypothetical protein
MLAKQAFDCLGHSFSPFCTGYFGVSQTISMGWPQIEILQISASQVARITGISRLHVLFIYFLNKIEVTGTELWFGGGAHA